ncbi:MAG TPA: phosphatase PAP2 family protein [Labilithrix sp.]
MRRLVTSALATVAIAFTCGGHARADEPDLRHDVAVDGAVTGSGAALWIAGELAAGSIVKSCRWCDRASNGADTLNGFDRGIRNSLRWSSTGTADLLSSIGAIALAPLAAFGGDALLASRDERTPNFWVDALIIAEATVLAVDVSELVKLATARQRPYAHFAADSTSAAGANLSFFSGHTTLAFALASSAGTVATMRGYRHAWIVWAAGMAIATATGYLRIAGDQHYATDVVTGAAVGGAIGVGVPLLFHRPRAADIADVPSVQLVIGSQLGVGGTW